MDQIRADFISAMRQVASGVSVVTTDGPAGRAGLTVSAMCSLSADPPALLICINRQSRAMDILRRNGVFCVNVLAIEQMEVARIFAGQSRAPSGDKFASARWEELVTGAPAAQDALAVFDCRIAQGMPYGSHDILVGAVAEARMREGLPLVYANRAYGGVARLAASLAG
ncbi:MAG TPA: flavin reductase [Nordella sp.]|nr:flavin reductase [Nordella sp.]